MGELAISPEDMETVLSLVIGRLECPAPALSAAGEALLASVRENFAAQGRPEKWAPLNPETAARKGSDTILVDTGALLASLCYSAGDDFVELTALVPYARAVQEGAGGIPARPFLLLQAEDVEAAVAMVERYILTGNAR